MSWTCPKCGRKFHAERFYHSCEAISMDDHLQKSSPEIRKLTEQLLKKVMAWKNVQVTPLKSAILVTAGSNFLSLKPRKSWIDVEFILSEEKNEFPVYKTMRYTRNKIVHFVKIDSKGDLNAQLTGWLKEAYSISAKL